jgi:hypothetical protein
MAKSITVNANKRGRPVTTGTGTIVGVRMLDRPLAELDAWIAGQREPELSRPEAIRRLVELGLKVKPAAKAMAKPVFKPGRKLRAQELAAKAIEGMTDRTAPPDEQTKRRHRLTKGPPEFREDRVDLPKAKGK